MNENLRIAKENYQLAKENPREHNHKYQKTLREILDAAEQGLTFVQVSRAFDENEHYLLLQAIEMLQEDGFTISIPDVYGNYIIEGWAND